MSYQPRDVESELQQGAEDFDRRLAALRGIVTPSDERRQRIVSLAEHGATEGERAAARAALGRFDASHAEADRMQRGGNWIDE